MVVDEEQGTELHAEFVDLKTDLGLTVSVGELGNRPLHRIAHAVGQVAGRDRAARGVPGNADNAILAHVHVQPPEGPGIGRCVAVDRVHHAEHRRRARRRLGQVEAECRHQVDAVERQQIDVASFRE